MLYELLTYLKKYHIIFIKIKEVLIMKYIIKKIYVACLTAVPVCAAFALTNLVNSTSCWVHGQEEIPKSAKKYRKF